VIRKLRNPRKNLDFSTVNNFPNFLFKIPLTCGKSNAITFKFMNRFFNCRENLWHESGNWFVFLYDKGMGRIFSKIKLWGWFLGCQIIQSLPIVSIKNLRKHHNDMKQVMFQVNCWNHESPKYFKLSQFISYSLAHFKLLWSLIFQTWIFKINSLYLYNILNISNLDTRISKYIYSFTELNITIIWNGFFAKKLGQN
jgi:hypothetical protein